MTCIPMSLAIIGGGLAVVGLVTALWLIRLLVIELTMYG